MTSQGFTVLDKPAGLSSATVLAAFRRTLPRGVKTGHAGTLDPFATGALLALAGDATRLSAVAMELAKEYVAVVRFGAETDTLDPTGNVVSTADPGPAAPPGLPAAVASFSGWISQVPPAYSALNVAGRRAYHLAREGEAVALPARRVRIDLIEIVAIRWPDVALRVVCGSGTYVRSLARDLGRALGLPAHLADLRRARIGPFLPDPAGSPLRPTVEVTRAARLPELALPDAAARAFTRGGFVPWPVPDAPRAAVLAEREALFLGLGRIERGVLWPVSVFASATEALR